MNIETMDASIKINKDPINDGSWLSKAVYKRISAIEDLKLGYKESNMAKLLLAIGNILFFGTIEIINYGLMFIF